MERPGATEESRCEVVAARPWPWAGSVLRREVVERRTAFEVGKAGGGGEVRVCAVCAWTWERAERIVGCWESDSMLVGGLDPVLCIFVVLRWWS